MPALIRPVHNCHMMRVRSIRRPWLIPVGKWRRAASLPWHRHARPNACTLLVRVCISVACCSTSRRCSPTLHTSSNRNGRFLRGRFMRMRQCVHAVSWYSFEGPACGHCSAPCALVWCCLAVNHYDAMYFFCACVPFNVFILAPYPHSSGRPSVLQWVACRFTHPTS